MKYTMILAIALAGSLGCSRQTIILSETVVEVKSPAIGTDGKLTQSVGIDTLGGVFTPLLFGPFF